MLLFWEFYERYSSLPPGEKKELEDFLQSLSGRHPVSAASATKHLQFGWAGALADLKNSYTSIELQKQALEWMSRR